MFIHNHKLLKIPILLMAVAILAVSVAITAQAQTSVQGRLVTRPITRGHIAAYKLPSTLSLTGGLSTVGVGSAVHLEAQMDSAIKASDITDVTWVLASNPATSAAVLADSPLGKEVPSYNPS